VLAVIVVGAVCEPPFRDLLFGRYIWIFFVCPQISAGSFLCRGNPMWLPRYAKHISAWGSALFLCTTSLTGLRNTKCSSCWPPVEMLYYLNSNNQPSLIINQLNGPKAGILYRPVN